MTANLPLYVNRPAESVHLQPYACNNTRLLGFFLRGDAPTMQRKLVDPILNAPTGGAVEYRVASDLVLLSFADAAHGTSLTPPDNMIGWVPENSWTAWIPLLVIKHELGLPVAQRLVFFPAYICVDNTWSLAAGREVYGFPKSYGPVMIPAAGMPPSSFKASTLVMKTFGPQNEGVLAPLLQVDCIAQEGLRETVWHDLEAVVRAIADMWLGKGSGGGRVIPGISLLFDLVGLLLKEEVPGVFLKQFRDAGDGTRACYQAIIEAGSRVTAFRGAGPLKCAYRATLADFASHPLASDLGVAAGTAPLDFAFWADFNFTIGAGTTIWQAGTHG